MTLVAIFGTSFANSLRPIKFTLLTLVMHTCVSIADYGTKYYAAKLPGNIYFNNCFTGLVGSLMTFPLIHRFGLKKTSTGLNMAAGVHATDNGTTTDAVRQCWRLHVVCCQSAQNESQSCGEYRRRSK